MTRRGSSPRDEATRQGIRSATSSKALADKSAGSIELLLLFTLAELHGGGITVDSAGEQRGGALKLWLPLMQS